MKIVRLIIVAILIIGCLCGCNFSKDNAKVYKEKVDSIESIQLVKIDDFDLEANAYPETLICEISDINSFIDGFSKLKCGSQFNDPEILCASDAVVKIVYSNGDFELITAYAQQKYINDRYHYGWLSFDQEQFDSFLSEYLPK